MMMKEEAQGIRAAGGRIFLAAACLLVLGSVCHAVSGQVTIVDLTYVHSGWYKHIDFITQPSDWTKPYDYYHGYTYTRAEIFSFENPGKNFSLHYCYFQDKRVKEKHACTGKKVINQTGVYYRRWQNSKMWQQNVIDWTRPLLNFMQIDNACDRGCGSKPKLRLEVIIVADGQNLQAPGHWSCPADWNCGGGGGPPPPTNKAPTANNQSLTVVEDGSKQITLSYSDDGLPSGAKYTFTVTQQPSHGSLSGSGQNVTYAPSAGYSGSDSFKWKVSDGQLDSNVATVSITVVGNKAPVASNQSVTTVEWKPVDVSLNCSDPDGGPNPITVTITSQPSKGSLKQKSGLVWTYTPSSAGSDSFQWKASDGKDESGVATVSITVEANKAPQAGDVQVRTVEGYPVPVTLVASDPDKGPDSLSVSVGQPSNGTVDQASGLSCRYAPDSGFSGTDSFTYTASDGLDTSAAATVTITVEPDSDGDGLPDAWERQYGLDPNAADTDGDGIADGQEDEDGDGMTNVEEFFLGKNPTVFDGVEQSLGFTCVPAGGGAAALSLVLIGLYAGILGLRASGRRSRKEG
jgi:hypothetical protein